jgi:hypothetical protein
LSTRIVASDVPDVVVPAFKIEVEVAAETDLVANDEAHVTVFVTAVPGAPFEPSGVIVSVEVPATALVRTTAEVEIPPEPPVMHQEPEVGEPEIVGVLVPTEELRTEPTPESTTDVTVEVSTEIVTVAWPPRTW